MAVVAPSIQTGRDQRTRVPGHQERARQVKMTYVYQGHIEKIPILEEILRKSGVASEAAAYAGDDLTDVVVMRRVGLAIAPGMPEPKSSAPPIT